MKSTMGDDKKQKEEYGKDEPQEQEGEKGGQSEYRPEEDKSSMNQEMDYSDIDEV